MILHLIYVIYKICGKSFLLLAGAEADISRFFLLNAVAKPPCFWEA
jgi:hypothetical protein